MRPCSNKLIAVAVVGLILIASGASLIFFAPAIFHRILQEEMSLSPESRSYEVWRDTSKMPPMYMQFYFYNWTNPEELREPGKKPNFVQMGPYTFREVREKVNITFNPHNNTVSYKQRKFWWFDESKSNGTLQDNITQLNVVAVSGARKLKHPWLKMAFQSFLKATSMKIYVIKTVDELLFTGYNDKLITMGHQFAEDEVPPFDRFGWFYKRNGSTDFEGYYNVDTGKSDISNIGILRNWNYRDTVPFFKSPCNVIEGSAGEFWPPYRTKDDITLFTADLCRPLVYEYSEEVTHMGMYGYKYELGEKTLGNATRKRYPHELAKYFEMTTTTEDFFAVEHSVESTDQPEEDPDIVNLGHCFCNGECSPSGLMNISACRFDAPAFISLPHFYKADPILLDQVTGLKPNDDDHNFYITLEPIPKKLANCYQMKSWDNLKNFTLFYALFQKTGIPLEVAAKLQINILLQEAKGIDFFNGVPKVYFPIFWFSMKGGMTEEYAQQLQMFLRLPDMCTYSGVAMAVIGTVFLLVVGLIHLMKERNLDSLDVKPGDSSKKSSEYLYLDKVAGKDDPNIRSDRRLYPKP